jgi:hypothetical protein
MCNYIPPSLVTFSNQMLSILFYQAKLGWPGDAGPEFDCDPLTLLKFDAYVEQGIPDKALARMPHLWMVNALQLVIFFLSLLDFGSADDIPISPY